MKISDLPQTTRNGFKPFHFAFHEGKPTATVYFIVLVGIMLDQINGTLQKICIKL